MSRKYAVILQMTLNNKSLTFTLQVWNEVRWSKNMI